MRNKLSFAVAVAAAVLSAFALTSPVVAEAARSITSGDIRNGTIRSKDVHQGTLRSSDVHRGAVRSSDVRDGTLKTKDFAAGAASVAAYARVIASPAAPTLDAGRTKNVVSVVRTAPGEYCLELPVGVNRVVAVIASPEGALGNASAQWIGDCGVNGFQVRTERLSIGDGGGLNSTVSNEVSFHVLVP